MTVVKVQCENGDIFRLTLEEEASFEAILQLVANGCHVEPSLLSKGLKYVDDEGDDCTLAPATFTDFLGQTNGELLKLKLRLPKSSNDVNEHASYAMSQPGVGTVEVDLRTERDGSQQFQPPGGPPTGPLMGLMGPPGLEKDVDMSGPGGPGGGPRRLLAALHMLRAAGMLTPAMFASLTVQWLPLVTQRVARKVDKINHMARQGLDQACVKMLEKIQEQAESTPGLEQHAAPLANAISGNRRLGESILELLKSFRGLSFEVQTQFCESLASALVPYLEHLTSKWFGEDCGFFACCASEQHHAGTTCAGCGGAPIVGPRFKCPVCPTYDLCGNCYPKKYQLHGNCPGCSQDFQCIIFPGKLEHCSKGRGRDKAKDAKTSEYLGGWGKGGWMDAGPMGFPNFPFHGFHGWPMPFMEVGSLGTEEGQDSNSCGWPKGKGKCKKGKHKRKSWYDWHPQPWGEQVEDSDDFEAKVANLLELQLGSEEVIRELLISHDGDLTQVVRVLTS
ncbi:unnamed protein product [Durusdinium trenchii]|uniref:ZZ-type domain-containing protein n=1 Tax=Durusdinium trenchii TaxID=1381693 RepID=A0ABP0HS51_9DINO